MQKQNLDYYLGLPWTYTVETFKTDDEAAFIVHVNELPGICAGHQSFEGAMGAVKATMAEAITAMLEQGQVVPEPINPEQYKGNIAYRTTSERHCALARQAKRRGISLSKLLDECVDRALR